MRVFRITALVLLSLVDLGWSQVDIPSAQAKLPMYRPVLVGTGPDALINRIDSAGLMQQGQKDAAIMFSCSVKKDGSVLSVSTIIPEHFPQISSVPTSSRAQVIGSR